MFKIYKNCLIYEYLSNNINEYYLNKIPTNYISNQKIRDESKYHITIISSNENKFNIDVNLLNKNITNIHIFILGLGHQIIENDEIYYLVLYSSYFDKIRNKYNLKCDKDYHITLGFKLNDIHKYNNKIINKSFRTIIFKNPDLNKNFNILYRINNLDILKYIESIYKISEDKIQILENNKIISMNKLKKNKNLIFYNSDILINNNNYLGYVYKYIITNDIDYIINAIKLYDKNKYLKYDKNNKYINFILKKINSYIMETCNKHRKILYIFDIEKGFIQHEMPRNFSWVISNKIGGISALNNNNDIDVLKTLNIKKIYYFLEKNEFDHIDSKDIEIKYIYCKNMKSPSIKDMYSVLINEDFNEPILFGCLGGFGRTGTALSCYLIYYGNNGVSYNSEQAITYLRTIRPKSIETENQLDFIRQFSNHLFINNSLNNINNNNDINNNYKIDNKIKFIMLVGLPGSGKSTFCNLFLTNNLDVKIINQDLSGKKNCQNFLLKYIKEHQITILDRTNYTIKNRKEWLELTQLLPRECLCVYLNTPKFICINRTNNRNNHPTVSLNSGKNIINDIDKKFEEPTINEGFYNVIKLQDQEDVANYLKLWKCNIIRIESENSNILHKFPRTEHLYNNKNISNDDKILDKNIYNSFFNNDVHISEKIDGSQLGFSIDENFQIRAQCRSHYVSSNYHSQYKLLDNWIKQHSTELFEILDQNTILFGEWLYAKHSIYYDKLPDYFIAFDLYDKNNKIFYNRNILENKLKNSSINIVNTLYFGKMNNDLLNNILKQKSTYSSVNCMEGVYIKIFDGDFVKYRTKIVNNNFICGNKKWSNKIDEINLISYN